MRAVVATLSGRIFGGTGSCPSVRSRTGRSPSLQEKRAQGATATVLRNVHHLNPAKRAKAISHIPSQGGRLVLSATAAVVSRMSGSQSNLTCGLGRASGKGAKVIMVKGGRGERIVCDFDIFEK